MGGQRAGLIGREKRGREVWVAAIVFVLTGVERNPLERKGQSWSCDRTWTPPTYGTQRPRERTDL